MKRDILSPDGRVRVLVDLRPALAGHSGIPQETRLLFRGLSDLNGVVVTGLLHSSNLVLEAGLPVRDIGEASQQNVVDRLSRVVVSLQQGALRDRLAYVRNRTLKYLGTIGSVVASWFGRRVALTRFEPELFKDFLWRALFAKSLPADDVEVVTSRPFRILRWPWAVLHAVGFLTAKLGRASYPTLDTREFDVLIAETPYPARAAAGTRIVVRYHDAIPLFMPHTIKDRGYNRDAHFHALQRNVRDGAWFACVSDATRDDLLSVFPEVAPRAVTIPNMIAHPFRPTDEGPHRVAEIVWSRKNRSAPHAGGAAVANADLLDGRVQFLLMVATIEPRKNHLALLDAWELLRHDGFPHLQLVLVGSFGWEHCDLLRRFEPWLQRGGLHMLEAVPSDDLRLLYRHADVTVCPSFGEGFDFPGVEAMRCGGVVAASRLPVHEGVFGSACEYFSPYDPSDMARAVRLLMGSQAQARRTELVAEGARVSTAYLPEHVMPRWQAFLREVTAGDR